MSEVTLYSDGTGKGTVLITESGEKLENIVHASVSIDARDGVELTLEVKPADMNIKGNITDVVFECPVCGEGFEHKCNTQLGGGSPSTSGVTSATPGLLPPATYPGTCPTGMIQTGTSRIYLSCSIASVVPHAKHYDATRDELF